MQISLKNIFLASSEKAFKNQATNETSSIFVAFDSVCWFKTADKRVKITNF